MATRTCRICGRDCPRDSRGVVDVRGATCTGVHMASAPSGLRPGPGYGPASTAGGPDRTLRRGRCKPCSAYWYKHGVERPARLWERRDG